MSLANGLVKDSWLSICLQNLLASTQRLWAQIKVMIRKTVTAFHGLKLTSYLAENSKGKGEPAVYSLTKRHLSYTISIKNENELKKILAGVKYIGLIR